MAFTQAPSGDTYSQQRLPAAYSYNKRLLPTTSALPFLDEGTVNLYPKKSGQELVSEVRNPLYARQVVAASTQADVVRGVYVWEKTKNLTYYYMVINNKVYTATSYAGPWTNVDTLTTTGVTTPVGFAEFIDSTNVKKLVLVDGVEGYVYTSQGAGTKITDPDFPAHLPYPVFLDGYLFLAKTPTADIYNSNLNDPALWTAGDFISSELYPDDVAALVKVNNYILAIGKQGCEFFYDAANPTGTPLARYEGGSLPFGCLVPSTVASNKNTVMFLANNNDGSPVFKMIEDFKVKEIQAPFLTQYINITETVAEQLSKEMRAYFIRDNGSLFYCLNISYRDVTTSGGKTFFYSIEHDYWGELAYGAVTGDSGTNTNFPVVYTSPPNSGTGTTVCAGNWTVSPYSPFFGVLGPGIMAAGQGPPSYGSDSLAASTGSTILASSPVYWQVRTPYEDYGTKNLKMMYRAGIDMIAGTGLGPVTVHWSDDSGFTYQTAGNLANVFTFPFVHQLGSFRTRQMVFTGYATTGVRIRYLEFDINKGQQ